MPAWNLESDTAPLCPAPDIASPRQRFFCEAATSHSPVPVRLKVGSALFPALQKLAFPRFSSQLAFPTRLSQHSPSRVPTITPSHSPSHSHNGFRGAGQHPAQVASPDIPGQSQVWNPSFSGRLCLFSACSPCSDGYSAMVEASISCCAISTTCPRHTPAQPSASGVDAMDAYKHASSAETSLLCQAPTSPPYFLLLPVCPVESLRRMLGESLTFFRSHQRL